METIQLKDLTFSISIPYEEIRKSIAQVAEKINRDYKNTNPLFVVVLNGAFMFAADLMKFINIDCTISFVKLSSYEGTKSTQNVKQLLGLNEELTGRKVIIVEDIVDTGITIRETIKAMELSKPADIQVCTLLLKPDALKVPLSIKYICMEIPNEFVVGYGLDYDGLGRNLKDIYTLVK